MTLFSSLTIIFVPNNQLILLSTMTFNMSVQFYYFLDSFRHVKSVESYLKLQSCLQFKTSHLSPLESVKIGGSRLETEEISQDQGDQDRTEVWVGNRYLRRGTGWAIRSNATPQGKGEAARICIMGHIQVLQVSFQVPQCQVEMEKGKADTNSGMQRNYLQGRNLKHRVPVMPIQLWMCVSLLVPDQPPGCPYLLKTILEPRQPRGWNGRETPLPLEEQSRNQGTQAPGAAWVPCVNTVGVMAQPPAEPLVHPFLLLYVAVPWSTSVHDLLPGFLCLYSGLGLILTTTLDWNSTSSPSLLHSDGPLKYQVFWALCY